MPAPASPFTRLPTTPTTSDIYDKLASVQNSVEAQTGTIAQAQTAQDKTIGTLQSDLTSLKKQVSGKSATQVLAFRLVTGSAFIGYSDYTVYGIVSGAATFTLPDAKPCQGQIFQLKNDATSGAAITMGSTNSQTIDGAAANTFVLGASNALQVQSNGLGWIVLNTF